MSARTHATKSGVEGLLFGEGESPGPSLRPSLAFAVLVRFRGRNFFFSGRLP